MQPAGGGRGKRLLYWFRTPPGVRVGRAPIDETAIRLLEQHNPDVEFDWTRILKAPPAGEGQGRRDVRDVRDRDQRGRRESRSAQRPRSGGGPSAPQLPARPRAVEERSPAAKHADYQPHAAEHANRAEDQTRAAEYADHQLEAAVHADHAENQTRAAEQSDPTEHLQVAERTDHAEPQSQAAEFADLEPQTQTADRLDRAEDQARPAEDAAAPVERAGLVDDMRDSAPFADVRSEDVGSASYVRLGAEGLVRLRARYAEVMARISERPLEEAAREELKLRAERLNPDAWVTADEVTDALEQYETVFEGLRAVVGRHPRRRQRGRR